MTKEEFIRECAESIAFKNNVDLRRYELIEIRHFRDNYILATYKANQKLQMINYVGDKAKELYTNFINKK